MYPFGLKVRVKAILRPAYITWVDEIDVRVPAQRTGGHPFSTTKMTFHQLQKQKLPQQEMRQVDPRGHKSELEGESLSNSLPVPMDGKKHRRLLRHEFDKIGVVVGWTWKAEGRFEPDDINFLVENRRQWGHEVALNYDRGDKGAWTTGVVFCLVDDLDPYDIQ